MGAARAIAVRSSAGAAKAMQAASRSHATRLAVEAVSGQWVSEGDASGKAGERAEAAAFARKPHGIYIG